MKAKSYAKVNIFLKITGSKKFNGIDYHTFNSRFMLVKNLYDTISFIPQSCETFTIEGVDGVDVKDNIIYKAYKLLNQYTGDLDILNFFYKHKVVITKNIPMGAGLGGGSSNAATFMLMVKDICNLKISTQELAKIGANIGADVPFFIYQYESANVKGFGEIIEPFNEKALELEIFTPNIHSNTAQVYKNFRANFLSNVKPNSGEDLLKMKSKDILTIPNIIPTDLNDLYKSAKQLYPSLADSEKENFFFSGSGSSFFKMV